MFFGKKEMLIDQQRNFVKKVKESNIDISYIEQENMVQVYPLFAGY
jgi:acetyl esterase/lipase